MATELCVCNFLPPTWNERHENQTGDGPESFVREVHYIHRCVISSGKSGGRGHSVYLPPHESYRMVSTAALAFGTALMGVGAFVYVLVVHIEPQPGYPAAMSYALRWLGLAVATAGVLLGSAVVAAALLEGVG